MALLTELFIQIVHSSEFVWLTFRVLAIRRSEKLTLDMYRRSTTTPLETNPFSQRIFLHSSLLQFCISFDRLCGRSSSCIGSIMSKFSPAVVFFNRTPFSIFCFLIVRHFQVFVANFLHIRDDLLVGRQ